MNVYTVTVVKYKKHWAVKATANGVSRYRFFYYRKEAEADRLTWLDYSFDNFRLPFIK